MEGGRGEGPQKGSGALSHAKKFWGFLWALENHEKFLRRGAICSGKPCGTKFQKKLQHELWENDLGTWPPCCKSQSKT